LNNLLKVGEIMLIIKRTAESNGAHASQASSAPIAPPDGWIVIPADLEATALPLLPWVKLTVEDGIVTAVEDDTEARAAWEATPVPPPEPTAQERIEALEAAMLEMILGGAT